MKSHFNHLLGIEALKPHEIHDILDRGEKYANSPKANHKRFAGLTQINMFFENSTRTQASFEIAGQRLGLDVMNMSMQTSSIKKGETLVDTAMTLNAMNPDIIVMRHGGAGSVALLADKVNCAVINAGDGRHEHPTQALLDALTLRRHFGKLQGLSIAICGDVAHSRVARSNIFLLQKMGAQLRLIGPRTLISKDFEKMGCAIYHDMRAGLEGVDVIMMLRLQKERMEGAFLPSEREYFHYWGLDEEKLSYAKDNAVVLHPGPMNRGVEISSQVADDPERSLIREQVEMGVAIRMAVIEKLLENDQ